MPAQVQAADMQKLVWQGLAPDPPSTADDADARVAVWTSKLFDLHPDLGNDKSTLRQVAAPVYGGSGLFIYLRMKPDPDIHLNFLAITYYERASAWGFNGTYMITGEQDVSMNLLIGNPPHYNTVAENDPEAQGMAGFLNVRPPGDTGMIRYWQPYLVFTMWKRQKDPDIFIESGWY
jgi:hypothetical protein